MNRIYKRVRREVDWSKVYFKGFVEFFLEGKVKKEVNV